MPYQINLQQFTQLHARRFTATVNNNYRFILQRSLNYQVVVQNTIGAHVLTHNQRSNIDHSEPQVRSLPYVFRRIVDDVATSRHMRNRPSDMRLCERFST